MIWNDLVKEHNLGAAIYTIEIKERIIRMKRVNLIMRGQPPRIIKTLINLQKIIGQQKIEKDFYILLAEL